jgi:sterol 3beta-glucosyltransferase
MRLFMMSRISIVASGSRGDVQPYVALGKGLRDAGHDVRILTSDDFAALVTEAGLTFCSTGSSIEATLQSDEWRRITESGNFLRILRQMRAEMQRRAADVAPRIPDLLAGSDLVVGGTSVMGILAAAEMLKLPVIQAYLFPFTPTRAFPSPLVTKLPFGRVLNRVSYHAMQQMLWQSSKAMDTELRRSLGLPKASFRGPFGRLARRGEPLLYGYSQHVLSRPPDWPAHYHVTGYWFLDEPDDWTPPADLLAFLGAGDPPVYIGFGSMSNRDPRESGELALDALARSGQRGVLAAGWGGLQPSDVPANVYLLSSIPHSWLFPRMAAVVHHGGAGTTAAGLRAGVPSVVVPFMGDQPFWGQRVAGLGVGPSPIPRKRLTSQRLADAISQGVTHGAMRQKASDLGQRVRDEDGVGAAVAIIDRFCRTL